jgi:hypothetical protein
LVGTPDASAPATPPPGAAAGTGAGTSFGAPGPEGRGTIAKSVLARTTAMTSPKPIPTAVWR